MINRRFLSLCLLFALATSTCIIFSVDDTDAGTAPDDQTSQPDQTFPTGTDEQTVPEAPTEELPPVAPVPEQDEDTTARRGIVGEAVEGAADVASDAVQTAGNIVGNILP